MEEFIENALFIIHSAKQEYIEGNDVYNRLNEIDILISKKAIELGIVGKMSKSQGEN